NFQSFLDRIAETDSTIYWDKAKSQDIAVSLGIQFPNAISNLDSNTIIRKAKAFVKKNEKKTSGNVSYSLKNDRAATVRKIKANANANNQRVYTKADSQRIVEGMSDSERAAILRKQTIKPHAVEIADGFDVDFEQLEKNRWDIVKKPMIRKLRDLGFLKTYTSNSIDVDFTFTGESLRKSMNSQVSDYGGNLGDLAKVVMNMQPLLDSAVLLEIHKDKAKGTPRENPQLLQTYVLLSAYQEGNQITPVQFEIKQYVDDQNRLYLAVALTKIEAGVLSDTALQSGERTRLIPASNEAGVLSDTMLDKDQTSTRLIPASNEAGVMGDTMLDKHQTSTRLIPASGETGVMGDTALQSGERTRLIPVSDISIPRLIEKINPKDENFFKYIPNAMLDKDQLAAKRRAMEKEAKKYGRDSGVQYALKEHTPSDEEQGNSIASRYSYEALTKKGNISVIALSSEIPLLEDGRIDNKEVVARGKRNAKKRNNPRNTETDVYVRVDDIGQDVLIGTKGLQHGLVRSEETARVVMKIGDVLKGSIAVNELNGSASRKTDMSYVLLGGLSG
ncbi:MAG: hypothetical protein IJW30_00835, partial [Clostridia bacterium]|nr:hypothetical protein [Clostridia bacterium]